MQLTIRLFKHQIYKEDKNIGFCTIKRDLFFCRYVYEKLHIILCLALSLQLLTPYSLQTSCYPNLVSIYLLSINKIK